MLRERESQGRRERESWGRVRGRENERKDER